MISAADLTAFASFLTTFVTPTSWNSMSAVGQATLIGRRSTRTEDIFHWRDHIVAEITQPHEGGNISLASAFMDRERLRFHLALSNSLSSRHVSTVNRV